MKKHIVILIFMYILAGFVFMTNAQAQIPQSEREALIDLYYSTDGDNWYDNTGWLGEPGAECEWIGVRCDYSPSGIYHVRYLSLSRNGLSGVIPPSIGDLSYLESIALSENQLYGGIPVEIGNIASMSFLSLWDNRLTGGIPVEIGNMSNLTNLLLAVNQLSGGIPSELGNLSNLDFLALGFNKFTGPLPASLGNLTMLNHLDVRDNDLEGPLPDELLNLTNLDDDLQYFCYNYFYTDNDQLRDFLNAKQHGGDWESCQRGSAQNEAPYISLDSIVVRDDGSYIDITFTGSDAEGDLVTWFEPSVYCTYTGPGLSGDIPLRFVKLDHFFTADAVMEFSPNGSNYNIVIDATDWTPGQYRIRLRVEDTARNQSNYEYSELFYFNAAPDDQFIIDGSVAYIQTEEGKFFTQFSIQIDGSFQGVLPDDIDSISISGPDGDLAYSKDDFLYNEENEFSLNVEGLPELGVYTFYVTSGGYTASDVDYQEVVFNLLGFVTNIHSPYDNMWTRYAIQIHDDFQDVSPDDISAISITGPFGSLTYSKKDFIYDAESQEFFISEYGSPELGEYTFSVTYSGISKSVSVAHVINRTIPIPDANALKPGSGETIQNLDPTFIWDILDYPETNLYYSVEIADIDKNRLFLSEKGADMSSYVLTDDLLLNSESYLWRVRVGDGEDSLSTQNESLTEWIEFNVQPVKFSIRGFVTNLILADGRPMTQYVVQISNSFPGVLPDDLEKIVISGPGGELPYSKDDFKFSPSNQEFVLNIDGSPEIGTYTFYATYNGHHAADDDEQAVIYVIPVPNLGLPADYASLSELYITSIPNPVYPNYDASRSVLNPTFYWDTVDFPDADIYYCITIADLEGNEIFYSESGQDVGSYFLYENVLEKGESYKWRVIAADGSNFQNIQNASMSEWFEFYIEEGYVEITIPPGSTQADFNMVSFDQYPYDPSPEAVFGDDMGSYDTENFRIGTYDPLKDEGGYQEYGIDLGPVEPGKAYWILARDGLNLTNEGDPVSLDEEFEIELPFNPATGDGWSMIGPPNNATYMWDDLQISAVDAAGNSFRMAIWELDDFNSYLDVRVWRWRNGTYVYYAPEGSGLIGELEYDYDPDPYLNSKSGYWVKAKQENVRLVFTPGAQTDAFIADQGRSDGSPWAEAVKTAKWFFRKNALSPDHAVAYSGDGPPAPMAGFSGGSGDVEDANGDSGGCFIESVSIKE